MRVLSPIVRIASHDGRLLITAEHVSFSGSSSWDAPREAVSGVSVSAGLVTADLRISTTASQQHVVPGVLFRDVLIAIELLGYLPPSPTPSPPPSFAKPVPFLSIPTNYMPGRFIITEQTVRLEGRMAWEVARADVCGVSIETGALTVRLLVHTRDGRKRYADHLPFNGALRVIERLGYIPRDSAAPLPVPDLSFPPLPPLSPRPVTPKPSFQTRPQPPRRPLDLPRRAAPITVPLVPPRESAPLPVPTVPSPDSGRAPAPTSSHEHPTMPLVVLARLRTQLQQWMTTMSRATSRRLTRAYSGLRLVSFSALIPVLPRYMARMRHHFLSLPRVLRRRQAHAPNDPEAAASSRPSRLSNSVRQPFMAVAALLARGMKRVFALRQLVSWPHVSGTKISHSAAAFARDSRRTTGGAFALILAVLLCVGIIADRQQPHGAPTSRSAQPSAVPRAASSGVATAAPTATSATSPVVAPVLKVFIGSHDGSLYALRASDGALLWRLKTGGQIESAPALAGGIVYAGSDDHTIYALRSQDDTIVWRYRTGGKVGGSPTVARGVVYIGSNDGYLYALRASDGALLWRHPTGNWVVGQPAVVNGIVYVGSYDNYLYALRASDGALLWRYRTRDAVVSSPAVASGVVYVGSADDTLYALRASDGATLWRETTGGSLLSSPAVVNGVVYIGSFDGDFYAFRARDGALLWRFRTGGLVLSSPSIAGTTVYIGSFDGYLYALRTSDGALLWRYKTGGAVNTAPVVAQGMVYIGSADHDVYALRTADGMRVWSFKTGDVVSPRLVVGS